MSLTEKILEHLQSMPESVQAEVLHFVEYLESKIKSSELENEGNWSTLSLSHAMRGLEEEPSPYSLKDVKDSFS